LVSVGAHSSLGRYRLRAKYAARDRRTSPAPIPRDVPAILTSVLVGRMAIGNLGARWQGLVLILVGVRIGSGEPVVRRWANLSRETQQLLFDEATAGDDSLRGALAAFLHEKHSKTAHPLK
jgi:hypothetical protein